MRRDLGKALREAFSRRMLEVLPEFREEKVKSPYILPGERAYRHQIAENLALWVVLSPSTKYDEFTVLIGWSKFGRYPQQVPNPSITSPERLEFGALEFLERLPYLMGKGDKWWVIKKFRAVSAVAEIQANLELIPHNVALELVSPKVEDAIASLSSVGKPYLMEFLCSIGSKIDG